MWSLIFLGPYRYLTYVEIYIKFLFYISADLRSPILGAGVERILQPVAEGVWTEIWTSFTGYGSVYTTISRLIGKFYHASFYRRRHLRRRHHGDAARMGRPRGSRAAYGPSKAERR